MLKKTAVCFLLLAAATAANAEVQLTEADILGSWQIDAESANSSGNPARKLNSVWTFSKDGTMEGVTQDSDANSRAPELRAIVQYTIENGKISKQSMPGRSKMETCTAVEKNGPKMTLECNNIYFFMTKK